MGFYYATAAKKDKVNPTKQRGKNIQRAPTGAKSLKTIQTLNRLGCKACPLDKAKIITPKMKPTIPKNTLVYFLAEAPGKDEDENSNKPLTGKLGSLLRQCIPDEYLRNCAFDNTINCRPPANRTPTWVETECCRSRRIKFIEQAKPKVIIGTGTVPLMQIIGSGDIAGMRGRFIAVQIGSHKCWFLATYHPSFVEKMAYEKSKPFNSKFGFCFKMDLQKVFNLIEDIEPPTILTPEEAKSDIDIYKGSNPDFQNVMEHLRLAGKSKKVATDLETSCLKPYSKGALILSASVSYFVDKKQKNFAFAIDHKDSKWTPKQREEILAKYKWLIQAKHNIKIAQNAPFEITWLIHYFGNDVVSHHVWEDTMVQAQFIDERKNKGSLGYLTEQNYGLDIKTLFKFNMKNMAEENLDQLLLYNGVDSKYTLKLHRTQFLELKRLNLVNAYKEALPRQAAVALMQSVGIPIDQNEVKEHQEKLGGEIKETLTKIFDLKVVQQFVKDNKEFNPNSNPEVLKIFHEYLKRPEIKIANKDYEVHNFNVDRSKKERYDRDNKGTEFRFSVDKNTLEKVDHPLAKYIIKYRNKSKMKSTYVDEFEQGRGKLIYPDGKIHSTFNTTFAETGRTSSDSPNHQNWPKRNDSWLRSKVKAPKGFVLIAIDYGQLEACVAAMCSKDKYLTKAIWEGYDIHMEFAEKFAHIHPASIGGKEFIKDAKVMRKFRAAVKNQMVFPAIFGAQDSSIAGYMNVPLEIIKKVMKEFWQTFEGLAAWQKKTMTNYYKTGYVETLTGRRRNYPMTRNQAINDPVQGTACDIVCDAMSRLSEIAVVENNFRLQPIWNIHDDLGFICENKSSIIDDTISRAVYEMLTPKYDFINVPLSAEVSKGEDWFRMIELDKFYSNKDI